MDNRLNISKTPIKGVFTIQSKEFADHRGAFSRLFCAGELSEIMNDKEIVQVNYSSTIKTGAIRGMHFQKPPHAEIKLIRCLKGKVMDVAVDLRKNSPTYLKWYATELSSKNNTTILIPEGCAHGFQVLEENSALLYMHTAPYKPESEGGVRHDDPALGIHWPLETVDLSEKDKAYALIDENFKGVEL